MPNPREAIYDVMRTKQDRAAEERRLLERRSGEQQSLEEALNQWNRDNQRARRGY